MSIQSEIERVEKEIRNPKNENETVTTFNMNRILLNKELETLKFAQSECDKLLQAQREEILNSIYESLNSNEYSNNLELWNLIKIRLGNLRI